MVNLPTYPLPGALGAARLRAALAELNAPAAAVAAGALPPALLAERLGPQCALRPWGCLVTGGSTLGVMVLGGGLAVPYVGTDWQAIVADAAAAEELSAPGRGWLVSPQGHAPTFGFPDSAAGAVGAAAALGMMMHLGVDLPTPLGIGGVAAGPDGGELAGREAWDAFGRVPGMWVAAAELFGVEAVLAAVANRVDRTARPTVDASEVLAALYPGAEVVQPDAGVDRWVVAGVLAVEAQPEAWAVGKAGGYVVTRWRCGPVAGD